MSSSIDPKRLLPLWEGRAVLIGTGLVLTLCTALLLIFQPLLLRQAELRMYDLMLSGRAAPPKTDLPVLVGIDEESLNSYGQWPWPRYRTARLVERLYDAGAKVVVLDFLMPEPDRTSPEVNSFERQRDHEPGTTAVATVIDSDRNSLRLAKAFSKGETALGFFFDFTRSGVSRGAETPVVPEGMLISKGAGSDTGLPKPVAMIRSIRVLTDAVRAEGFTNATHDCDGALRRVPLLLPYKGNLYPSLSMAALLLASEERNLSLTRGAGETFLTWGNRRIPLDDEGNLLIDFRSETNGFRYLSARSVLDGRLAVGALQGKIVLVGSWAKGLGDYHLVPSGKTVNGLAIHATIIDNILSGSFIGRPGWARGAELFALLLLGAIGTWLLSRPGFMLALLTVATGSFLCYWSSKQLLLAKGVYLSPLLPMLMPVLIMTFLSLLKYGIEARKVRQRTRDLIEAQDTIIFSMSALTEARDKETGGHILRTRRYVELLIRQMVTVPGCCELDENSIELLIKSAPLHDIGKVGIPDAVLHKQGKLSPEEYEIMKSHPLIGAAALSKTIGASGRPEGNDFLHYAKDMVESHHERWDGNGYPHGLRGKDIPLAGRLMALADVYDALTSRRIYKQAFSHEKAMEIIVQDSGKQFDPDVVAAFVIKNEVFHRVAEEAADELP